MSAGIAERGTMSPGNGIPGAVRQDNVESPRTGAASAPVNHYSSTYQSPRMAFSSPPTQRHSIVFPSSAPNQRSLLAGQLSLGRGLLAPPLPYTVTTTRRSRASSLNGTDHSSSHAGGLFKLSNNSDSLTGKKVMSVASASLAKARARSAQKENDAMVYLDGPQVYTCAQCRTHLTSHDDIISKSFHGRHGRAYLFDQCVNVTIGKAEDRFLITGLHSVCDIFCKRCKSMVGWTYARAYEASQKYKEKKFIIEKINLHLEESPTYDIIPPPAGERPDRWRRRSMSWGSSHHHHESSPPSSPYSPDKRMSDVVFEYHPSLMMLSPSAEGFNLRGQSK